MAAPLGPSHTGVMSPPEPGAAGGGPPALTVAAAARRLGVAPATLRTWARRYGLGPSEHEAGSHRRYTSGDLARLVVMRRLTLEGVPPVEAARTAVESTPGPADGAGREGAPAVRMITSPAAEELVSAARSTTALVDARTALTRRSSPAGRDALQQAALDSDAGACTRLVAAACAEHGPVAAWEDLVSPALRALGRRWEATGVGVDTEVLLSAAVLAALRGLPAPERTTSAVVLLATAEGETSSLPLHVLAAEVAAAGAVPRVLAPGLPREALAAAVRRTGPVAVLLHASRPVADGVQLAALPRLRAPARLVLSGPGWDGVRLPEGRTASRAETLACARELLDLAAAP